MTKKSIGPSLDGLLAIKQTLESAPRSEERDKKIRAVAAQIERRRVEFSL